MSAESGGEEWVLNGQKVWTTGAQHSDFGAVSAHTNVEVPKRQGITMFVVDLTAPGVEVWPLRQMTGGANFNEVFFNDVRIPAENVIGSVGGGWYCAIAMLMNERVAIGSGGVGARGGAGGGIGGYLRLARAQGADQDPVVRQGLGGRWPSRYLSRG